MYGVKAESVPRLHHIPKMAPARTNYQKAMVDDVSMGDFSSSSFEAHGLPVPSSDTIRFTGNGSTTPVSDFSQTLPILPPLQRSSAPSQESGLHIVGRRVQVLVDAINDIRGMGVDYLVDLPQLVLVGDQSAGKSSLMGALAEIHLPQDSGCCTRCPTHIKTGHAEIWSCKISLHLSYAYAPRHSSRPIQASEVTKNVPFPPWLEKDNLVTQEFTVITDKSELEEALRWAQIAILNPTKPPKLYVPGAQNNLSPPKDTTTEAKFSPNVVSVEMSGPGLPPLSFFDLPGIFQNPSQKEDDYLVKVVENLAKKYIKHQQALVIHALPMSADPTTSRAGKVIRDLKAENRTIGVLTKADCLQIGHSDAQFKELLEGLTHKVKHGYFVTKQMQIKPESGPPSRDEGYHAKSRQSEEAFFDSTFPWSDRNWKGYRKRCGTENLQRALSQKFAAQIVESIPRIEETVRIRSEQIEAELATLPELPTHNISQVVLQELARFSQQMQALMDGTNFSLHSKWNTLNIQLYQSFHELLFPMFIIRDPLDVASAANQMEIDGVEVISLDDDSPILDRGAFFQPPTGPQGTKEEPHVRSPKRFANGAEKHRGIAEELNANPFAVFQSKRLVATIGEIRLTLAKYTKPGAPGHIDFRAKDELCMQSVKVWEGPIQKYVDLVLEMSRQQSQGILDQVLSKWVQTELYKQGLSHLDQFFNMFEESMKNTCNDILELEFHKLFTINNRSFEHYKEVELRKIKDARRRRRATILAEHMMRGVNVRGDGNAKRNAIQQKIKSIKDEDLGEDPFRAEIDVAALVRAYYLTAADRICDQICLNIHSSLFKQAQENIFRYLEGKLGLDRGNTEQRCRELMEEDPHSAQRRRSLQQEKAKLQELTARLVKLAEDDRSASVFDGRMETPEVNMSM